MRRRQFITLLAAAAAWPIATRAQQPMPVIGFLNSTSPDTFADRLRAFRQGLKESGYVEGENVAIEYRWAEGQNDRLPLLAADLVRRQSTVIAATNQASALAAKTATATIPIVFLVAEDPVGRGLVASLARPGGNLTGINFLTGELVAKRLELLRDLVPAASRVAVLVNPANATSTETTLRNLEPAARAMGLQIQVLNASTSREINAAFATFVRERPDEAAAKAQGVKRVCIPNRSTKSAERKREQRKRWFRNGQKWRTGCEGRISVTKRRHGLNRCRYKGADGMKRWVGLGVIADNLINMGRAKKKRTTQ